MYIVAAITGIVFIVSLVILLMEVILMVVDSAGEIMRSRREDKQEAERNSIPRVGASINTQLDNAYLDGMVYAYWIISGNIKRGVNDPCDSIENEIMRRAPSETWRQIWRQNGIKPRDGSIR